MNGLRIAKEYYNMCRPLLWEALPDIMAQSAAGLAGEGSECFGLDDEASRDHDFGAAFCLWLPDEILERNRERIQRAFQALPEECMGQKSRLRGDPRVGARGVRAFYEGLTGLDHPPSDWREWLELPETRLAAAVNGEVFEDRLGAFSDWRGKLQAYYPEDARLKKLAARAMAMAQAGQYNLPRSLKRGDQAAAMLALARFAEAALSFTFLLNKRYMPYYKLAPRMARTLPILGAELHEALNALGANPPSAAVDTVEDFCGLAAERLRSQDLSSQADSWLWSHGPSVAMRIQNPEIRARNLLID